MLDAIFCFACSILFLGATIEDVKIKQLGNGIIHFICMLLFVASFLLIVLKVI